MEIIIALLKQAAVNYESGKVETGDKALWAAVHLRRLATRAKGPAKKKT